MSNRKDQKEKQAHNHSHGHGHGHHHHPDLGSVEKDGVSVKLWISIVLNLLITIAEVVGGIIANSLALLSDALHNFSDTASLGISLAARRISRKDANKNMTFGYKRAEIIGAFINLITLVLIALFLLKEGIERFWEPREINGVVMFSVAIVGLIGNGVTVLLLAGDTKDNINLQSAFIHILSDAFSSVGVIIGGWIIMKYGFVWLDSLLTVIIGIYILFHSYYMLRTTIDILMESTPTEIDWDQVLAQMQAVEGVQDVHHLHIWRLDERNICLEGHVVIEKKDLNAMEKIKEALKKTVNSEFGINHTTLEFEFEPCEEPHLLAD